MISVCIPVFNLDVSKLAESLGRQAEGISAEIIFIDDGSDEKFRALNRNLQSGQNGRITPDNLLIRNGQSEQGGRIRYYKLEDNIGRSRIRNRFLEYANYDHLLFLDCDSVILSEKFLEIYAEALREFPGRLICGGRIYDPVPRGCDKRLHWKYGIQKESKAARIREQDPWRSFMSNNFLVPAAILKEIPFDEGLSGYGHEDSLFGYELSRKGFEILHIDNPVLHGELETNREFVDKSGQAIRNLVLITEMLNDEPGFIDSITLLRTASRLESAGLAGIARRLLVYSAPVCRWILRLGIPSLKLLNAFKLGVYLRLKRPSALNHRL